MIVDRSGREGVYGRVAFPRKKDDEFTKAYAAVLFVDALKYMDLFVAAVRELRQRPELIAKNQLAMRATPAAEAE